MQENFMLLFNIINISLWRHNTMMSQIQQIKLEIWRSKWGLVWFHAKTTKRDRAKYFWSFARAKNAAFFMFKAIKKGKGSHAVTLKKHP